MSRASIAGLARQAHPGKCRTEKQLREGNAFSLRQLAGRIGVEPSYLSKIERGIEHRWLRRAGVKINWVPAIKKDDCEQSFRRQHGHDMDTWQTA